MAKTWTFIKAAVCTVLLLLGRKVIQGYFVNKYVKSCTQDLSSESLLKSPEFVQLVADYKDKNESPAFFFLNKYALDMTSNWLCNTQKMAGVHDRSVFVTLDETARDSLTAHWPNIRQFYRPTPCLQEIYRFGEGPYHAFFVFRSNFASAVAKLGRDFWMMQQDTVWRDNIFDLKIENNNTTDIIFDQLGFDNSARAGWINGANFFVHSSPTTQLFFDKTARKMTNWYVPDASVWINQCHRDAVRCENFLYSSVSPWEWLYFGDQKRPPYLIQMDGEADLAGKLSNMKKYGFYFLNDDSVSCNNTAVEQARENIRQSNIELPRQRESVTRFQFSFYWAIAELLLQIPILGPLIRFYLPLLCYYLMLTM